MKRVRPTPPPDPTQPALPALPPIVPEYVTSARVMQRRNVSKRKLPSYTEAMTLLHMPELQRKFWAAMLIGLEGGEKDVIRMAGEIMGVVEKRNGITITQSMMQANVAAGDQSPVKGFDAFARELAESRAGHALPALPEPVVIDLVPSAAGE